MAEGGTYLGPGVPRPQGSRWKRRHLQPHSTAAATQGGKRSLFPREAFCSGVESRTTPLRSDSKTAPLIISSLWAAGKMLSPKCVDLKRCSVCSTSPLPFAHSYFQCTTFSSFFCGMLSYYIVCGILESKDSCDLP